MSQLQQPALARQGVSTSQLMMVFAAMAFAFFAPDVLAAENFQGADKAVCNFFDNVEGLLSMASIAVVTIAVIFAGYQIAFAHKRISDVAPILVGGLLIGAASQIASMLLPSNKACSATTTVTTDASQYLIQIIGALV